jgi:hypothetical protein
MEGGGCHTLPSFRCSPVPLGSWHQSCSSRLPCHRWLWLPSQPSGGPSSGGRRCLPLGLWAFCCLPSALGTHLGLCPFGVRLFQVNLLESSALTPIPTALWPISMAGGAHPLVSAFLAGLWARSPTGRADSALPSDTLSALFFRRLSWLQAALLRFWGVTTPVSLTSLPASTCNLPQHLLQQGAPFALLLTWYPLTPKSANPTLYMAETLRGGAPMIFGATPPPSNVLAAFILSYLNWLVCGCFVAKK